MAQAHTAGTRTQPPSTGLIGRAVALAAWIGLCDLWLKAMARIGGCDGGTALADALRSPWHIGDSCPGAPLLGQTLRLLPASRNGGPFDALTPALSGVAGQLWGLGLLALATALSIVIVRWQWRERGDALALGVLWAGCLALAVPRLVRDGSGLTEMTVAGVPTGIGDLALLSALVWLAWRAIAEARA